MLAKAVTGDSEVIQYIAVINESTESKVEQTL